jgi:hypothetical protein
MARAAPLAAGWGAAVRPKAFIFVSTSLQTMTQSNPSADARNKLNSELGNLKKTSQVSLAANFRPDQCLTYNSRRLQILKHNGLIGTVNRLAKAVQEYTTTVHDDMAALREEIGMMRQEQQERAEEIGMMRQEQQERAVRSEIREFQLCAWEAASIVRDKIKAAAGAQDFWHLSREQQDDEAKKLGISIKTLKRFLKERTDGRPETAHPSPSLIAKRWRDVKPAFLRQQPKKVPDYEKLLQAAGVIRSSSSRRM